LADKTYEFLESVLNTAVVFTLMGKTVEEQDKYFEEQMGIGTSLLMIPFWERLITSVRRWAETFRSNPERLLPIRLRQEGDILRVSTGYRDAVRNQIRLLEVE
jgi:hypothetical protein